MDNKSKSQTLEEIPVIVRNYDKLAEESWKIKMISMNAFIKRRNRGLENFPVENSDCPPAEDFLAGTKF